MTEPMTRMGAYKEFFSSPNKFSSDTTSKINFLKKPFSVADNIIAYVTSPANSALSYVINAMDDSRTHWDDGKVAKAKAIGLNLVMPSVVALAGVYFGFKTISSINLYKAAIALTISALLTSVAIVETNLYLNRSTDNG